MSYIYGDLIDKLKLRIGDSDMDSTLLGDCLNYSQQQIFGTFDNPLNSATQTNTLTVSTRTLASPLPTDFQRVSSLYITSPTALALDVTDGYVDPKTFRLNFNNPALLSPNPPYYWTYTTEITFAYLSNLTYTVLIDYIKTIAFMSADSDVPTVPQSFEELLMLGAMIRAYEDKEDFDYAAQFKDRYNMLTEAFATRYSTRQVDNQAVLPSANKTNPRNVW